MTTPNDFFVGIVDFFAIVLPGSIATAMLKAIIVASRRGADAGALMNDLVLQLPATSVSEWAVFLAAAYVLGQLIFITGSYLDGIYDVFRKRLVSARDELAYVCAKDIRDKFLLGNEKNSVNTFQWCRTVLQAVCPLAATEISRLEADSKFFRSALVICIAASLLLLFVGPCGTTRYPLLVALPGAVGYYKRRLKGTTQAYLHVISLYRLGSLSHAKPQEA